MCKHCLRRAVKVRDETGAENVGGHADICVLVQQSRDELGKEFGEMVRKDPGTLPKRPCDQSSERCGALLEQSKQDNTGVCNRRGTTITQPNGRASVKTKHKENCYISAPNYCCSIPSGDGIFCVELHLFVAAQSAGGKKPRKRYWCCTTTPMPYDAKISTPG